MPQRPDVLIFAAKVVVVSFVIAVATWSLPAAGSLSLRNSMLAVPAASIMLCAKGASWRRRLTFVAAMLAAFVSVDALFVATGLLGSASASFGQRVGASALGIVYGTLVGTTPVVALVLFLRKDPSILWSGSAGAKPASTKAVSTRKGARKRRRS